MSKKEDILRALQKGAHLTPAAAFKHYGCMTLSQRVSEWRRAGLPIRDKFVDGKNYKEYWWEPQEKLLA